MTRHGAALLLSVLAVATTAETVRAEPPPPSSELQWDPRWRRFSVGEGIATGLLFAGVGVGLFFVPQTVNGWRGGIAFDDAVRDGLVLTDYTARQDLVLAGDVFFYGLSLYPVVVDVWAVALIGHQSADVAGEMFAISAQSLALSGLLSTYTQKLIGRVRPYVPRCAEDPAYDPDCGDDATGSQSAISGHTALAFTGAGLICSHHAHLPLYGGGAGDVLACALGLAGASVVGVSRTITDRHYLSDVLSGAAIGAISGYLLPELLHYRFGGSFGTVQAGPVSATVLPFAQPEAGGLTAGGRF